MMLLSISTLYVMLYAGIRPHWDNNRSRIEITNEVLIMIFNYHMVIFSEYCLNEMFQFYMGFSNAAFIGILVLINITNMLGLNII